MPEDEQQPAEQATEQQAAAQEAPMAPVSGDQEPAEAMQQPEMIADDSQQGAVPAGEQPAPDQGTGAAYTAAQQPAQPVPPPQPPLGVHSPKSILIGIGVIVVLVAAGFVAFGIGHGAGLTNSTSSGGYATTSITSGASSTCPPGAYVVGQCELSALVGTVQGYSVQHVSTFDSVNQTTAAEVFGGSPSDYTPLQLSNATFFGVLKNITGVYTATANITVNGAQEQAVLERVFQTSNAHWLYVHGLNLLMQVNPTIANATLNGMAYSYAAKAYVYGGSSGRVVQNTTAFVGYKGGYLVYIYFGYNTINATLLAQTMYNDLP